MASSSMLGTIADGAIGAGYAIGHWVYDFQTLITGAAAIGAAWYAGAPVWRQLKDSNLQTHIMHRETLAIRLREAEERAARISKSIDGLLWRAQELTSDHEGDPLEIGAEEAFGLQQSIRGRLDWYLVTLKGTEDERIEAAKSEFRAALLDLTTTLDDVHRPASTHKEGDGYVISDEDWAEIEANAQTAKKVATDKVSAAWAANRALKAKQNDLVDDLRKQIALLDARITSAL